MADIVRSSAFRQALDDLLDSDRCFCDQPSGHDGWLDCAERRSLEIAKDKT